MAQRHEFVGIDVAKADIDVFFSKGARAVRLSNDAEGFRTLCGQLENLGPCFVAVEASGGYESDLLVALLSAGHVCYRLDPAQVRHFARGLGERTKTDPIDARMIAACLEASVARLRPVERRPDSERLAELAACRAQLVAERTAQTSRLERARTALVRRLTERRLRILKAEIRLLDQEIARTIESNPETLRRARLLRTAPGVGPVLAATLIADMPELGRISGKAAAALVGVAPYRRQSGKTERPGRCAGGRRRVRKVLYMATLAAIRAGNPALKPFHDRLKTNGKPPKVAIVAAMRKFITILNAMAATNTEWKSNTA